MSLHIWQNAQTVQQTPRVNPNGNAGLQVIAMCSCSFISYDKRAALVGMLLVGVAGHV